MNFFRSKPTPAHQPLADERPARRISTAAGQRLSIVLENTHDRTCFQEAQSTAKPNSKINVTTTSTYCNDPTHQHIDPVLHVHQPPRKTGLAAFLTGGRLGVPSDPTSHNGSGSNLSVSVWSAKDEEKFGHVRDRKHGGATRGCGWKKIALIAAVVIAMLVALAVGLGVGLKKKSSSSSNTASSSSPSSPSSPSAGEPASQPSQLASAPAASSTSTAGRNDPPPTSTLTPSTAPENFPLGTYSLITFLDTVNKNCTSDPNTWICSPDVSYYSDPQQALAVMHWEISGKPGAYKLTSRDDSSILGTAFQNVPLELVDVGRQTERYRFQMARTKTVNVTGKLGKEEGDFECDYGTTTLQGDLYTKMARTYPQDTVEVKDEGSPAWPYAARVEQVVAGGQNVPLCKTSGGQKVAGATDAMDGGSLCSCLYKNWTPVIKGH